MSTIFLPLAVVLLTHSAVQADPFLIVPGRSIGQTELGRNGDFYLKRLPPPDGEDAWLGGNLARVWQAKPGGETLYIHTFQNAFLEPPRPGATIAEIRVTSRRFHTRNGVPVGATLAQIRRYFPQGLVAASVGDHDYFYMADRQGVAFEFARRPALADHCIAITVYPPNQAGTLAYSAMVKDILRSGQHT